MLNDVTLSALSSSPSRMTRSAASTGSIFQTAAIAARVLPLHGCPVELNKSESAPPLRRRLSRISVRIRCKVAVSRKRSSSAARPPSTDQRGSSDACKLEPEATNGY
jgi:hypothetical protein